MKNRIANIVLELFLGILLVSPCAVGAEFDDADILPGVVALAFTEEHVGIQISKGDFDSYDLPGFVLNRSDNTIGPMPANEFASLFGLNLTTLQGVHRGQHEGYLTTDGTRYSPYRCDGYDKRITAEMAIDDEPFPVSFDKCVSVSEIETVGEIVWTGTYYAGSHGYYGGMGLLALSRKTGDKVAQISTGSYPINNVRYDSIGDQIWAITRDQVVVANKDMTVDFGLFFYYDFDSESGWPVVRVAKSKTTSHPLAVFALHLPTTHYRDFYDAVETIPDEKARSFSLYDFYMCCQFAPLEDRSIKPKELEILIPFLLPAFENDLPRWKNHGSNQTKSASRMWRQIACHHKDNVEARRLCGIEDWGKLIDLKRDAK